MDPYDIRQLEAARDDIQSVYLRTDDPILEEILETILDTLEKAFEHAC